MKSVNFNIAKLRLWSALRRVFYNLVRVVQPTPDGSVFAFENQDSRLTVNTLGHLAPTHLTVTSNAVTAVPEPASWALMLFGIGALGWTLRGRRRNSLGATCKVTTIQNNLAFGAVLAAVLAAPASADVIYSNGPTNGTGTAIAIQNGQVVSDSFVPIVSGSITSVEIGIWTNAGNSLRSVSWSFGTSFLGNDLGTGTATPTDTFYLDHGIYTIENDVITLPGISVVAGNTYYFSLFDAFPTTTGVVYWDVNNGPSTAEAKTATGGTFPIQSEAFTLFSPSASQVPEPASWALMLFGFGAIIWTLRGRRRTDGGRGIYKSAKGRLWALRGAFVMGLPFALGIPAQAAVIVASFTATPNPFDSGSSELLTLNLAAVADPGYSNATFNTGSVTFDPGNGASPVTKSFGTAGSSATTATISQAFTYTGSPGQLFTATASYIASYSESGNTGIVSFVDQGSAQTNLQINPAAAVPEPLTASLFSAGLAGAVMMRRRRKGGLAPLLKKRVQHSRRDRLSFKWPAPIFLLVALYPCAATATPLSSLSLVYEANFDDGTLNPSFDSLGIGPLQIGDTLIPGSNPTGVLENGGLTLGITRPASATGPVGVGAIALASFGQSSIVGMRAVYALPVGPHDPAQIWATTLTVRTNTVDDLPNSQRAAATLQVIGNAARLNTSGASTPAGLPNIPQDVYDAIFSPSDPNNPATFTLELVVDRITGTGFASLSSGGYSITRDYAFAVFGPDFGPDITALGPVIAVNGGINDTASVRVLDFQIFAQPIAEPPSWILFASGLFLFGAIAIRSARRALPRIEPIPDPGTLLPFSA